MFYPFYDRIPRVRLTFWGRFICRCCVLFSVQSQREGTFSINKRDPTVVQTFGRWAIEGDKIIIGKRRQPISTVCAEFCVVDQKNAFLATLERSAFDFFLVQRPLVRSAAEHRRARGNHKIERKILQLSRRPAPRCGVGVKLHRAAE